MTVADNPMAALVRQRLDALDAVIAERQLPELGGSLRARLGPVLGASDFAHDVLQREPGLLHGFDAFVADPRPPGARDDAPAVFDSDESAAAWLRRFRRRESLRLVARDVAGLDPVERTLSDASRLAEHCIERALRHVTATLQARYGVPRGPGGAPQRLVVIGMGKLGGGELNFSSDIDLVFAFGEAGQCDGPRALANEDFFARLGQRLIQLLADVTADGLVYRVDMRLRPFGAAGRLALSFNAMEHYYQREGRDWERYAWIKARPVAGDLDGGARLVDSLRPFVFRRYLDYTAFDGLREMKRLIDAEVARKELADHVKLGPGGIREIEFMVQLVQLVRGGREPALRAPGFLAALDAVEAGGHIAAVDLPVLRAAYAFLRRVENRLQMLRDEQTHELPADPLDRERIATGLGFDGYDAFAAVLQAHRDAVASAFDATLEAGRATPPIDARTRDWTPAWRELSDGAEAPPPAPFGGAAWRELTDYARGAAARGLEARARERVDRLMPALLGTIAAQAAPDAALSRVLALLKAVAGRPSYLALLDEQRGARERVVQVFARSAFLAERVSAHPLLLDDLLDARVVRGAPDAAGIASEIHARLALAPAGDVEEELTALQEARQSLVFRCGLAWLDGRIAADVLSQRLAQIAQHVASLVLDFALRDTATAHGPLSDGPAGLLVLGYGSLGGAEFGFGSDVDLVMVFDGAQMALVSNGARPLEGGRWFARAAQRVLHWLTTPTRAGRLYEVDTRLRPDGSKGLLVSSLDAFAEYQHDRAWLWEHQALVRARAIAGEGRLVGQFDAARAAVLAKPRDRETLLPEVVRMRERWRSELDRSAGSRFDLKQGRGGIVDLEFLLQALVLLHASSQPELLRATRTVGLIAALARAGILAPDEAGALTDAHAALLSASLTCTLDAAARVVDLDEALQRHRSTVLEISLRHGLDFRGSGHS
jgi:glutamate-ammonia-ligase adenylyltransferase